jgi:hypothetical protein
MRQNSKSDSRPCGQGWNPERRLAPCISHGPDVEFELRGHAHSILRPADNPAYRKRTALVSIGCAPQGLRPLTLTNVLEQRGGRYGLQTMCEGGGMANATIIERPG